MTYARDHFFIRYASHSIQITVVSCVFLGACSVGREPIRVDVRDTPRCSTLQSPPPLDYIATGSPSGTYIELGRAIAKNANTDNHLHIGVCTTDGSNDNLNLLRDRRVSYALVQLDALHYEMHNPPRNSHGGIRVITYLYSEVLHVFVQPHFYLNSLGDLGAIASKTDHNGVSNKQRIWLGLPGSGGLGTASKVLQAAGIAYEDIAEFGKGLKLGYDNATQRLLEASRDKEGALSGDALLAYFRTMALPKPGKNSPARTAVEGLLEKDAQLLSLPPELIDRLSSDGLYVPSMIPLNTYEHMTRGVATIGIPTLLVTNLGDGNDAVHNLLTRISDSRVGIEDDIGVKLDLLNKRDLPRDLDRIVHPGANEHFQSNTWIIVWICAFPLGIVVALVWRDPLWFRRRLAAGAYLLLLIATLSSIWIVLSFAMMQAEGIINPDFANMTRAMWRTLGIIVGPFKDYRLMTHQGEVWRWVGLFLFPVVFGWLMSDVVKGLFRRASDRLASLIQRAQAPNAHKLLRTLVKAPKRGVDWMRQRPPRADGAIVFLNWDDRALDMIQALRQDLNFVNRSVIVVQAATAMHHPSSDLPGVQVLTGDPTERATMEKARISDAAIVTILSAWSPPNPVDRRRNLDPDIADSKTILAILTLRAVCEEMHRRRALPIKVEIRLARNQETAKRVAQSGNLDVTCLSI